MVCIVVKMLYPIHTKAQTCLKVVLLTLYTPTLICIFSILSSVVLDTFPKVLIRRICFIIKSFFNW